jgi:uncharacterized protein YjaZ
MSCALHVLNADGSLSDWLQRISDGFDSSLSLVASRIPVGDVDVVVFNDSGSVVPELGMSGFCRSAHRMYLPIDTAHPALSENFERVFRAFFAHEMHHCARRHISGYASTLGQALVTEGLACCFEAEFPGGSVPMYATRVRGDALVQFTDRARPVLNERMSGWGEWFFGEREPDIPMHAGYALGYEIVSAWLRRNGTTAAAAYEAPAADFLAEV